MMTKTINCRDVGPDCDAVVTADSEDEIVAQVQRHAQDVHGMSGDEVSDATFVDHVRRQIHDLPQT